MAIFFIIIIILICYFLKTNFKKTDTKKDFGSISVPDEKIIDKKLEIPEFNYIGQTIFLDWADGKAIKKNTEYPQYFFYDYGILNCEELHQNLIKDNFLEKATMETILLSKNIDELKKILEEYGLKKNGKKVELVERIIKNNDFSKINTSDCVYELSEKGKEFVKKYSYILELKGTSISVEEFEKEKNSPTRKSTLTRDIMWAIYNKHSLEEFYAKNFGLYRNTIYEMARFLEKEKRYKQALIFQLKVLYCDLSGKSNNNSTDPKEYLFITNSKSIFKLKEYFSNDMIDSCWQVEFPFHYCNKEIFSEIVSDILKGVAGNKIIEKYKSKMKDTPKDVMLMDFEE